MVAEKLEMGLYSKEGFRKMNKDCGLDEGGHSSRGHPGRNHKEGGPIPIRQNAEKA
jgi:hypothetical protein